MFDFWNEFVVFPPNIVSSPVSPQHQSSAVTISLQKLTFSAFISFITLKRFKPTKHNISVSITCSPSQRSKISNVDTFMQEFDRNYDSLTSPQKNHTRKEYCCWTLKSPSLIFEEPMMKESKNTRLTILRQNSNRSLQSADPRGAAQMINYRLAAAASKKRQLCPTTNNNNNNNKAHSGEFFSSICCLLVCGVSSNVAGSGRRRRGS